MLEVKHLYKFTSVAEDPTLFETYGYIGNLSTFEYKYHRDQLLELLYGDNVTIERIKIFKIVPIRGEVWLKKGIGNTKRIKSIVKILCSC